MPSNDQIREHMEVIGADGVHVGTVDQLDGHRIKLTRADSGERSHKGHHHYISVGLVAGVEAGLEHQFWKIRYGPAAYADRRGC